MLKAVTNLVNVSQITGVLPVVNGGTGVTTSTGTGNTVLSASPTFTGTAVFATLSGGTSGTGYSFSGSAPATSLTLNSSGQLGIGGPPAYRLDSRVTTSASVVSAINLDASGNSNGDGSAVNFSRAGNALSGVARISAVKAEVSNNDTDLVFSNFAAGSLTEKMRIAGATGVVTMSTYGAGAATFSAAGVISSVSDETWKVKDGVPTDPDAMLKKLEPGYWYYNDEKKETFGTDRQLGFYAQNVNAAIGPEAAPTPETIIIKNKDGIETTGTKPWGYYDRSVLAVTVMSLQKALATIESLSSRIATLENK